MTRYRLFQRAMMCLFVSFLWLGCQEERRLTAPPNPNPRPPAVLDMDTDTQAAPGTDTSLAAPSPVRFPALATVPDAFRFVVFADPQVGPADTEQPVLVNACAAQKAAIQEINGMTPLPSFAVWVGDLVDLPDEASFDNFRHCIETLFPLPVLTHGNHDSQPPYDLYKALSRDIMGFEDMYFSFDAGRWHFVALPSLMDSAMEERVLAWLQNDLAESGSRPTMIFEHFHGIPIGLNQMEWYGFFRGFRIRLQDIFETFGNVRYYLNGHVHNGIKASVKTAYEYRGVVYISVPAVTRPRPFGEEYPGFEQGVLDGGYYLVVDVAGGDIRFNGRLVGREEGYPFPDRFPEFTDDMEPRWRNPLQALPSNPQLVNGGFESQTGGLDGWNAKFRYRKDEDPAFVAELSDEFVSEGRAALKIRTTAEGPEYWAFDEHHEVYQIVDLPPDGPSRVSVDYRIEEPPVSGGGIIRITALSAYNMEFVMMFTWGDRGYYAINLPRVVYNEVADGPQSHGYLETLGARYRGMYFDIEETPLTWHNLSVDVRELYDRSHMNEGAFDELGIEKLVIGLATWVNRAEGSTSAAFFDNIRYEPSAAGGVSTVNGVAIPCDGSEFETAFGHWIEDEHGESIMDDTAPLPLAAEWLEAPAQLYEDGVRMVAVTAVDPHGVEYYFEETSGHPGGSDSGWQLSPVYVDTGLVHGCPYAYRVRTRDMWRTSNAGSWSPVSMVALE